MAPHSKKPHVEGGSRQRLRKQIREATVATPKRPNTRRTSATTYAKAVSIPTFRLSSSSSIIPPLTRPPITPPPPSPPRPYFPLLKLPAELLLTIADSLNARDIHRLVCTSKDLAKCLQHPLRRRSLTTKLSSGHPIIHWAARHNRLDLVRFLLDSGVKPDAVDITAHSSVSTSLHAAAEHGHTALAKLLLSYGADVDGRWGDWCNPRPLRVACLNGHLETARLLISSGADVDYRGSCVSTTLFFTAQKGHTAIVRLLLNAGADPLACIGDSEHTICNVLVCSDEHPEILEMLLVEIDRREIFGAWKPFDLLHTYKAALRSKTGYGPRVKALLSSWMVRVYGREFMNLHGYRVFRSGRLSSRVAAA